MRVRAGVVVVVMPEVSVVRRVVVVVGAGVATLVIAEGCSGAAAFWTWVAAKAEIPVKAERATPVARTRSTYGESISGRLAGVRGEGVRVGMWIGDQIASPRA